MEMLEVTVHSGLMTMECARWAKRAGDIITEISSHYDVPSEYLWETISLLVSHTSWRHANLEYCWSEWERRNPVNASGLRKNGARTSLIKEIRAKLDGAAALQKAEGVS